jgi:hypothetical protein
VGEELRREVAFLEETWTEILMMVEPAFAIRLAALATLIARVGSDASAERWRGLANLAAITTAEMRGAGVADMYDVSLGVPFAHLRVEAEGDLERVLELIERYRLSGIEYWLLAMRPPVPSDDGLQGLLAREEALITDARGARFVLMIPKLPKHFLRHMRNAEQFDNPENPLDLQRAMRRLRALPEEFAEVWAALEAAAPDYARARRRPLASIEAFAEKLVSPLGPAGCD